MSTVYYPQILDFLLTKILSTGYNVCVQVPHHDISVGKSSLMERNNKSVNYWLLFYPHVSVTNLFTTSLGRIYLIHAERLPSAFYSAPH